MLVWDGGVTTCQSIEEMHDLCNRLGITDQDYDFVELMQNARAIDWNNLPQYPYYYAKRKVQPVLNPTGDPSQ